MMRTDIAIVGGGPAGTSTALHLVRREGVSAARIVILDKAKFPRDKPCAGAISQLGLDVLGAIGIVPSVPSTPMRGLRVIIGDVIGETEAPMGICIRRTEFDAELLHLAAKEGVTVLEGDGLTSLERTANGFTLTTQSGQTITTRYVAAADGAGSTTRKLLGLKEPERKGHLYVLDTDPVAADSGVARGLVDFDLSTLNDGLAGYYWDFPTPLHGKNAVSRGIYDANLARDDRPNAKDVLARSLSRRGIDINRVKLRPFSTRPYVEGSVAALRNVVLVGEACGIDQTTGEGIAQAIEMGRIAAHHLATGDLLGYAHAVRTSTTGRHLLQSAWLAKRVFSRSGAPMRRLLLKSAFARAAAINWYRGESLGLGTHLRLGLRLAASLFPIRQ